MYRNTQDFLSVPFVENTGDVVGLTTISPSTSAMVRAASLVNLAMHELSTTERYSLEQLTGEVQRQSLVVTVKGGISAEQQEQIRSLLAACAAELRTVNEQLGDQLLAILAQA